MNASAVYSKSGKGVQEASGKTSLLSRSDRAVLAAIDGRATLADVAQKVGKPFDAAFEKLIGELDKGGFIREVSAGVPGPAAKPGAGGKTAAKPASPMDAASDLDFTTVLSMPRGKPAPPASRTQPTHTAPVPPPPPPPSAAEKAQAEKSAKEQQDAFARAREEAERKAAAERERVKAEAEAKMRAEQETKMRAEADAKLKAEAEAKVRAEAEAKVRAAKEAAEKAAAEAKARAEAEAKRAREEAERARREAEAIAERARKEAEEKAERARREVEDKARREQEELKRKLEEERQAREEAERRAREEAKRLEEERRKIEEERTQRRIQEGRERAARAREEAEEAEREDKPKKKPKEKEPEPLPELPKIGATSGGFSNTLLADLESFNTRDDQERKEREEAAHKEKEAADARAREIAAARAREEAERQEREAKEARKREAAERKALEDAELRSREERERQRLQEEEEKRRREAEERAKKAKEEESLAAQATRAGGFDAEQRAKRERDLMARSRRTAAVRVERKGWGKPIAVTLFVLLVAALAAAHVMPIDTSEYERAATRALGRPVKIGSANLWLVTGLQLRLHDVRVGEDIRLPVVRAFPELSALTGERKEFSRIEIERLKLAQDAVGNAFFVKLKSDTFSVGRVVLKNVELTGPLVLPKGLELEVAYDWQGAVMAATVRGPEGLLAKLAPAPKGSAIEVDMSAASFTLPFAPEISLSRFSLKGVATPQGMNVSEWDGAALNGTVSGTANVRWGESWAVDGIVTARNINAAVFAPALLSDGKAEGSGKFSMRGQPGKLAAASRIDGTFTVTRGVLGSIDLSRAIQTGGRVATGQTQFNEMNGQATYDRGAVSLRNVSIGAGQLSAGGSADISQNGALSGRIVADVKIAQQRLSATLNLAGTVKEPQVRN
jgi:hypothetical protein